MTNTIQVRRGANASLPTLNAGELGFSTDTHQLYIGDGVANHEVFYQDDILSSTQVEVSEIGTATYDDMQDYININQSSGVIDGCEITENAAHDFSIDISAGEIFIKTTDSDIGDSKTYDISASSGVIGMSLGENIIYINYNAGTPIFATTTDLTTLNFRTTFPIGRVYRTADGYLHLLTGGLSISNPIQKAYRYNKEVHGLARVSGMVTSLSNLVVSTTAGVMWRGLNRLTPAGIDGALNYAITAVNTGTKTFTISGDHAADIEYSQCILVNGSTGNDKGYHVVSATYGAPNTTIIVNEVVPSAVADGNIHYQTFMYLWLNNGTWVLDDFANTEIDNLQYNDISTPGSETLATLSNNQYGVHWVYIDFEGCVVIVYGQSSYTLTLAENATVPSNIPSWLPKFATLAAKIIVKKSASTGTVATSWETVFTQSAVNNHNDLGGLQGGAADDYYHLTNAQHTDLTDGNACTSHKHAATQIADGTVTDAEFQYINSLSSNAQTQITARVTKALFDANTIIKADSDDTPEALTVAEQTIVGRITAGVTTALTPAQVRTLINVEDGSTADQTGAQIKTLYEAEANAYTDTKNTKLNGIEELADVTDAVNVASSIHGVAAKATPVDADELGLIDSAAVNVLKKLTWANTKATLKTYFDTLYNNYVHPNHTGEVTSTGDGATVIADDAVTYAKMQNVIADERILGNVAAADSVVTELTKAQVLTMLNVADGADVTGSNAPQTHAMATHTDDGALATKSTVGTAEIDNDAVTYAKIQNVVADERILGNVTAADSVVEELTKAQVLTMLNVADGADITGSNAPQAHDLDSHNACTLAELSTDISDDSIVGLAAAQTLTNKSIELDDALSGDHTYEGITIDDTVGENVAFGDILYIKSDGKWWKGSSAVASSAEAPIEAMAVATILANAAGKILLYGTVYDATFNFTTLGKVYAGVDVPTPTIPSTSGHTVQIIGTSLDVDRMLFKPDSTYIELA